MAIALLLCVMALMTQAYGQACGGTFTASSGTISSPLYPSSYPNNQHCMYVLKAVVDLRVKLLFSFFNLQSSNPGCTKDYVEIRDGCSMAAPVIARHCGLGIPPAVTSLSNCLHVTFVSDASVTAGGFLATYTIIP